MGVPKIDFSLSPQEQNLIELEQFLQMPNSVGVDSLKQSLLKFVQLLLELIGLDTGAANQHLTHDEHKGLMVTGARETAFQRQKKRRRWEEIMMELETLMSTHLEDVFTHVDNRIERLKLRVDSEIAAIDRAIAREAKDCPLKISGRKAVHQERLRLKALSKRIHSYDAALDDAFEHEDTARIIEIEQNILLDLEHFNGRGAFPPEENDRATTLTNLFVPTSLLLAAGLYKLYTEMSGDPTAEAANALS